MRVVPVFVSSPDDALDERKRVSRVVARLNHAFKDTVRLEAVRWEERFYSAHDGFQPQIPRSGECDVVLAVLRGRLGSPLSPEFNASLPAQDEACPFLGPTLQSGVARVVRGQSMPDRQPRHRDDIARPGRSERKRLEPPQGDPDLLLRRSRRRCTAKMPMLRHNRLVGAERRRPSVIAVPEQQLAAVAPAW